MRKWSWVIGALAVLLIGLAIWVYESGYFYQYKSETARTQVEFFVKQCRAYRQMPEANGKYPARLLDLVEPPEGMKARVDGGKAALIDPWGNQYKYALIDTDAEPVPYVWVEREINGRLHLIGAMSIAGKTRFFGPDDH